MNVVLDIDKVDVEPRVLVGNGLGVCLSGGVVARDIEEELYFKQAPRFQCQISYYFMRVISSQRRGIRDQEVTISRGLAVLVILSWVWDITVVCSLDLHSIMLPDPPPLIHFPLKIEEICLLVVRVIQGPHQEVKRCRPSEEDQ